MTSLATPFRWPQKKINGKRKWRQCSQRPVHQAGRCPATGTLSSKRADDREEQTFGYCQLHSGSGRQSSSDRYHVVQLIRRIFTEVAAIVCLRETDYALRLMIDMTFDDEKDDRDVSGSESNNGAAAPSSSRKKLYVQSRQRIDRPTHRPTDRPIRGGQCMDRTSMGFDSGRIASVCLCHRLRAVVCFNMFNSCINP